METRRVGSASWAALAALLSSAAPAAGAAAAATPVSADVTADTTWTKAGSPYVVSANVAVAAGVTLTLAPGAVVQFAQDVALTVRGTLSAAGTAADPITFTGTAATAGWWTGLVFAGASGAPTAGSVLDHVLVQYAGWNGASVDASYSRITVSNSSIQDGIGDGIHGGPQGVADVSATGFSRNTGHAIRFDDGSVNPVLSGLTATANGTDAVAFGAGQLSGPHLWAAAGLPYHVLGDLVVATGGALTVAPGVRVNFEHAVGITANGPIVALGLPQAPILFTASNMAASAHWAGLTIAGTSGAPNLGSDLAWVTVENGGWLTADVALRYAQLRLRNATVKGSSQDGLRAGVGSTLEVSGTAFASNAGYAVVLDDASIDPSLAALTFTGNGHDGVAVGAGTVAADQRWEAAAGTYFVRGNVTVGPGASLTVEPGVTVALDPTIGFTVNGTLLAGGTAAAPIRFTSSNGLPGGWDGIHIAGSTAAGAPQNAGSVLDQVILENGGWNGSILALDHARATVTNAVVQGSSSDGVRVSNAAGTVIDLAQIAGNGGGANYGVRNDTPTAGATAPYGGSVAATHVWWGSASGPLDTACNPAGGGSRVTAGVEYLPFLAAATDTAGAAAPVAALSVSLSPQRWYAPADGVTRVWVQLTVRTGDGLPAPGRTVRMSSSLGTVVDGGVSDVAGQTLAYLTSTQVGEAVLTATLEGAATCQPVHSATSRVTFTTVPDDPYLGAAAPYLTGDIEIGPEPITTGVPGYVRAKFTNPGTAAVKIDASFGIAQLGIGLTFGPVGATSITVPALGSGWAQVPWTPLVPGHQCVQLQYTVAAVPAAGKVVQAAGADPTAQHNVDAKGGALCSLGEGNSLDKARRITNAGQKVGGKVTETTSVQWAAFGYILDFNYDTYGVSILALQGDPPTLDYRRYAMVETFPFTPMTATAAVPQALADATNAVVAAALDVRGKMKATQDSLDRRGGASAAGDQFWASQQTAAYIHYKHALGTAFGVLADKIDAYVAAAQAAGIPDLTMTPAMAAAWIAELQTTGWDAPAIQAGNVLRLSAADMEQLRRDVIAAGPDPLVGDALASMQALSGPYRDLGQALLGAQVFQPTPGLTVGGGTGLVGGPGHPLATVPAPSNLVRLYPTASTFTVGNPLTSTATIDLVPRPVDLAPDWSAQVTPARVTLGPGQQATATLTLRPGGPVPQGSRPRVAVEAFSGGALLGGVVTDVVAPGFVAMPDTCDAAASLGEGATCTCSLECGGAMMCVPTGTTSQCLVQCDTTSPTCPHASQTCTAVASGTNAGVCTPAWSSSGAQGGSSKGCGCSTGTADAAWPLLLFLAWPLRRRRPGRRSAT